MGLFKTIPTNASSIQYKRTDMDALTDALGYVPGQLPNITAVTLHRTFTPYGSAEYRIGIWVWTRIHPTAICRMCHRPVWQQEGGCYKLSSNDARWLSKKFLPSEYSHVALLPRKWWDTVAVKYLDRHLQMQYHFSGLRYGSTSTPDDECSYMFVWGKYRDPLLIDTARYKCWCPNTVSRYYDYQPMPLVLENKEDYADIDWAVLDDIYEDWAVLDDIYEQRKSMSREMRPLPLPDKASPGTVVDSRVVQQRTVTADTTVEMVLETMVCYHFPYLDYDICSEVDEDDVAYMLESERMLRETAAVSDVNEKKERQSAFYTGRTHRCIVEQKQLSRRQAQRQVMKLPRRRRPGKPSHRQLVKEATIV
jgi:hypothetical protein